MSLYLSSISYPSYLYSYRDKGKKQCLETFRLLQPSFSIVTMIKARKSVLRHLLRGSKKEEVSKESLRYIGKVSKRKAKVREEKNIRERK